MSENNLTFCLSYNLYTLNFCNDERFDFEVRSIKKLFLISVFLLELLSSNTTFAEYNTDEMNWIQAGNCWVRSGGSGGPVNYFYAGFLYCGGDNPTAKTASYPFLILCCLDDYRAVLVAHEAIETASTIRSITADFGNKNYTDTWMASTPTESSLSSSNDPSNQGYNNLLTGLSNPESIYIKFSKSSEDLIGKIELKGSERQAVEMFVDICGDGGN